MRPVSAYLVAAVLAAFCPSALPGADANSKLVRNTTLLLQFEQPHSERTLRAVRTELGDVMKDAGFTFELRLFSELSPYAEFGELIIVRLKGKCRVDAGSPSKLDQGALAFTHTSEGKMLPFVEVACDRVRNSIRPAMWGEQFKRSDELMGRALARVIAHEIYHIMTGSSHGSTGIARHALSGRQLIADNVHFDGADIDRMIAASGSPGAGF